jgi:hypothetical protein
MLIHWDTLTEKDIEPFIDALICGLEDASSNSRESARKAYLNLRLKFPKRAEYMKEKASASVKV